MKKGWSERWCSVNDVKEALNKEECLVVDIRKYDVYTGWTIDPSDRGGHIPGAWDWHILEEKPEVHKKIILYGNNVDELEKEYQRLTAEGYGEVYLFLLRDWLDMPDAGWEVYPNYQLYVPAEIVKDVMEGNYPKEIPAKEKLCIVTIGWGDEEVGGYLEKHIPGSVYMNSDEFEPPRVYVSDIIEWRLATDEELGKLFQRYGIDEETVVIVIGKAPSIASRFALICNYMGVDTAYVLNRGEDGWKDAGYPFEQMPVKPGKPSAGMLSPKKREWILTLEEAKKNLDNPSYQWVDIRTWDEYIGKKAGYDYHRIAGTIPGAKFGCVRLKYDDTIELFEALDAPMCAYRNSDMTMKNPGMIKKIWQENGIDLSKRLVFFCGSGWRASEVLWDAFVMGIENATLFSDGWNAWSNEGNRYIKNNG